MHLPCILPCIGQGDHSTESVLPLMNKECGCKALDGHGGIYMAAVKQLMWPALLKLYNAYASLVSCSAHSGMYTQTLHVNTKG